MVDGITGRSGAHAMQVVAEEFKHELESVPNRRMAAKHVLETHQISRRVTRKLAQVRTTFFQ